MGGDMFRGLGTMLLTAAFGIAAIGGGIGYGISHLSQDDNDGAAVGVRMTQEQQILRKNGAVCDAYLTAAFSQSLKEGRVVDLKLPANPAQNCPPAPGS
ncbi:MAG: hypothetical protein EPN97_06235 [Alphaproteobacteria bacterium]|nr:MAG: hypothetical protein EPN97_06235 [Alphaproteobacteria bacterium]